MKTCDKEFSAPNVSDKSYTSVKYLISTNLTIHYCKSALKVALRVTIKNNVGNRFLWVSVHLICIRQLITTSWSQFCILIQEFYTLLVIPTENLHIRATLWTNWKLGRASNVFFSTFCHGFRSVEVIGGCSSVVPPLIVLLDLEKSHSEHF